jgi:ribose 5-phosphate isomerase A
LLEVPEEGVVGLGSGSTAKMFIDEIGALVRAGRKLRCVATSIESHRQAAALGIPLLSEDGLWTIDVCVDGADEVSDALDLIKGGGGALTREKIVNYASARNVTIVDASKLATRLCEKWAIPVEVLSFAHPMTASHLATLGKAELRTRDGSVFRTDAGNVIYDVRMPPLDAPAEVDRRLRAIPGVVETGLFVGRCDLLIVASAQGMKRVRRGARP